LTRIEYEHSLERVLAQLPERCRRLIHLLYFTVDEPSYAEISRELGMPVSSIGPNRARCFGKAQEIASLRTHVI